MTEPSRDPIGVPQEATDEVCHIVSPRLRYPFARAACAENIVGAATCHCFAPTQPSRRLRPHVLRSAGRAPHPEYSRAEAFEFNRLKRHSGEDQCTQSWASHDYRRHSEPTHHSTLRPVASLGRPTARLLRAQPMVGCRMSPFGTLDAMLRDILLLVYCAAVGFVAAGVAASFYTLVTAGPARFSLFGGTVLRLATSFIFFALTGPVVVSAYVFCNHRAERWPFLRVLAGMAVAALWSCCLGVMVLQVILMFRHGFG